MKNLKLILLIQITLLGGLSVYADDNCPCEGGTAAYSVDCDGDGTNDACSTDDCPPCTTENPNPDSTTGYDCDGDGTYDECDLADCPDITISGPAYVEMGEDVTLTVSVGKADYTWAITSGASYVSDDGSTTDSITITGDSEGAATIEVTDDNGKTASHDITCFSVELSLSSDAVEDGQENIEIELTVEPASLESELSNITIEGLDSPGGSSFDNPDGEGLTISQDGGSLLDWKIELARWFKESGDDCESNLAAYVASTYKIEGTYDIDSVSYDFTPVDFEVTAVYGTGAEASVDRWYSHDGTAEETTADLVVVETIDGGWFSPDTYKGTVDTSELSRIMNASATYGDALETSQFYGMIVDEEDHHVQQLENSVDGLIDPALHFSVSQVSDGLDDVEEHGSTEQGVYNLVLFLVNHAFTLEYNSTWALISNYSGSSTLGCQLESAAKSAASSAYHLELGCAYQNCN